MDFEQIKELIKLVTKSKVSEFKYEDESSKFSIRTKSFTNSKEVIVQQPPLVSGVQMPMASQPAVQPQVATPATDASSVDSKAAEKKEDTSNYIEIKSPMVGTFYRSPSPEKGPYVKVGDIISVDDTICLIEAMKLFNEVKSEVNGKIVKVLLEDASPVEYDQVLFLVEPV